MGSDNLLSSVLLAAFDPVSAPLSHHCGCIAWQLANRQRIAWLVKMVKVAMLGMVALWCLGACSELGRADSPTRFRRSHLDSTIGCGR